jgi:predicted enzyme related to lactoylglutathione lyase
VARPTHFEIPVEDADRAEKFYRELFGWTFQRYEDAPSYYGMTTTGPDSDTPGINGALFQRTPENNQITLTMSVDSIDETAEKAKSLGASVVQEKAPIPGMGYFAVLADTEGNRFGLFTNDPAAIMPEGAESSSAVST